MHIQMIEYFNIRDRINSEDLRILPKIIYSNRTNVVYANPFTNIHCVNCQQIDNTAWAL